jgi:tetratricopeptide (TPR) repeat protein
MNAKNMNKQSLSKTNRVLEQAQQSRFTLQKFLKVTVFSLSLFAGCSSAPKQPPETTSLRTAGERQLAMVNQEMDRGNFETALSLLDEVWRIAVAADDLSLRVRTGLSRGNIFLSQGRQEEAGAEWAAALAEAEGGNSASGDRELAAVCRVYAARGRLLGAIRDGSGARVAGQVKNQVEQDLGSIKNDTLSVALGWTVIGLAEKEDRRFAEAEAAVRKALAVHEKDNYLEYAAYDWYLIASIRSVAGRYPEAVTALGEALALDRRAENSWGLAMDWRAMAEVYRKQGRNTDAEAAAARSKEILQAINIAGQS